MRRFSTHSILTLIVFGTPASAFATYGDMHCQAEVISRGTPNRAYGFSMDLPARQPQAAVGRVLRDAAGDQYDFRVFLRRDPANPVQATIRVFAFGDTSLREGYDPLANSTSLPSHRDVLYALFSTSSSDLPPRAFESRTTDDARVSFYVYPVPSRSAVEEASRIARRQAEIQAATARQEAEQRRPARRRRRVSIPAPIAPTVRTEPLTITLHCGVDTTNPPIPVRPPVVGPSPINPPDMDGGTNLPPSVDTDAGVDGSTIDASVPPIDSTVVDDAGTTTDMDAGADSGR